MLWIGFRSRGALLFGSFDQLSIYEYGPGPHQRNQPVPVRPPPPPFLGLQQLVDHRHPRLSVPWSLREAILALTVANGDSIGLVVLNCRQCSAG